MYRTYPGKIKPPGYKTVNLERALMAITSGRKTYQQASKEFGVPEIVLRYRVDGRSDPNYCPESTVRNPTLCAIIEKTLMDCLKYRAQIGFECNANDLKKLVSEYMTAKGIETDFFNGVPSDNWCYNFEKKLSDSTFVKPIWRARLCSDDASVVNDFYKNLNDIIANNNVPNTFVFDAAVSGFEMDHLRLKANLDKENIISHYVSRGACLRPVWPVLVCISADGNCIPPFIMCNDTVEVPYSWASNKAYLGTTLEVSQNGLMNESLFFTWFSTVFVKHVEQKRFDLKINATTLLLCDLDDSFMSIRVIEIAIKYNVILFLFPINFTAKLQPLEKCMLGPLHYVWEKKLIAYGRSIIRSSGRLTKSEFIKLIGTLWSEKMKPYQIISGFASTGIFPVDKAKFSFLDYDPINFNEE